MALIGRLVGGRSLGKIIGKLGLATVLTAVACGSGFAQTSSNSIATTGNAARTTAPIQLAKQETQQTRQVANGQATIPFGALPPEAQTTTQLIRRGGPFPYAKDGVPFGNREKFLPVQHRGYYREYTVPTPRAHTRGARRIVCGGARPTTPEACYYTNDHYASFKLIVQ
ncbi:ribonuclease domain-containing protein [soil metagenome]